MTDIQLITWLAAIFVICGMLLGNRITVWRARRHFSHTEDDLALLEFKWAKYDELIRIDAGEMHPDYHLDAKQKKELEELERYLAIGATFLVNEIREIRKTL